MMRKGILLTVSLLYFALCARLFVYFLEFHQGRVELSGIEFNDGILNLLPRGDVSVYIFSLTYGSILLFLLFNLRKPDMISRFALAGGTLQLFRVITMSVLPLVEPSDFVHLEDPFLNNLIYPGNITTDLFFSGHTAFVFVLFFLSKKKIYLILGSFLGILLMIQRVHYSIDILGAIPVAYLTSRLVTFVYSKFDRMV